MMLEPFKRGVLIERKLELEMLIKRHINTLKLIDNLIIYAARNIGPERVTYLGLSPERAIIQERNLHDQLIEDYDSLLKKLEE